MTDPVQKPKPRLVFATKTFQQLPFQLGFHTFIAKRLTAEEELLFQEATSVAALGLNPNDDLLAQSTVLTGILQKRLQDGGTIDRDWVEQQLGPSNMPELLLFLRTGHNGPGLVPRAGEGFELEEVEPLEIGGRIFAGRLMNYGEFRRLRSALNEMDMLARASRFAALGEDVTGLLTSGNVKDALGGAVDFYHEQTGRQREKAQIVADMLNTRRADDGDTVDGAWLLEHMTLADLEATLNFYLNGKSPEPEGDTPNAPTQGNLHINA